MSTMAGSDPFGFLVRTEHMAEAVRPVRQFPDMDGTMARPPDAATVNPRILREAAKSARKILRCSFSSSRRGPIVLGSYHDSHEASSTTQDFLGQVVAQLGS